MPRDHPHADGRRQVYRDQRLAHRVMDRLCQGVSILHAVYRADDGEFVTSYASDMATLADDARCGSCDGAYRAISGSMVMIVVDLPEVIQVDTIDDQRLATSGQEAAISIPKLALLSKPVIPSRRDAARSRS